MQRPLLIAAISLALSGGSPALACTRDSPIVLGDVRYADVVLVGRISDYQIIRDEVIRQEMLSDPIFSAQDRQRLGSLLNETTLAPDYARFEIEVDEVLVGMAPAHLSVTWDNSTFEVPGEIGAGPFLIALRRPSSAMPPLRVPSVTLTPNAEPDLFTLLQAPCSSPFLFESSGDEAKAIRRILSKQQG